VREQCTFPLWRRAAIEHDENGALVKRLLFAVVWLPIQMCLMLLFATGGIVHLIALALVLAPFGVLYLLARRLVGRSGSPATEYAFGNRDIRDPVET